LTITQICRFCGSSLVDLIYDTAQDYITGEIFEVWQCKNCAIAFTLPIPTDFSRYYPTNYRRYNPLILNILKFFYRLRARKWAQGFKIPGVAFELGCGDGLMLDTLRGMGWRVIGNERTLQSAFFARHKLELPVFVGGLDSLKPKPIFDLILLFQVLEHLEDPARIILQLSQLMKKNGKIIICVPNFGGWQSRFSKEKWFHLDVPRHLHHFNLTSLKFHLMESGLEIERSDYISFEHDPYGWIQSLLNIIDHKPNRLTRLLMQIDQPNPENILHLATAIALSIFSLPLAVISWFFNDGAVIEIILRKYQ
jgi:SAM-dependent methyltransferase